MRNPFRRLRSVGAKVVWIVALISGAAVLAVTVSAGLRTYRQLRDQAVEAINAQALIVAVNTGAPLAFRDREMAGDALGAFRVVEGVRRATLLDAEGKIFAEFVPPGHVAPRGALLPVGRWRVDGDDVLVVPVADQAGLHGRLQVRFGNARLRREALSLALQTGLLSLGAILLALLLARRLHPVLTAPIVELERAARRVRDTGNYGVRVPRGSEDELGDLTESFNEMLARVEAHQNALVEAQRRAEDSSRLKDEFVATLSHELRTPLSPVLAWIHMLRMPGAAAQLPQALDVMERNARSLVGIIDDLLDMSRIVSGTLRMEMRPLALDAVIEAAVETLAPTAAAREVRIATEPATPSPVVRGDPARLQQVVWNLLANAIKFSRVGGTVVVRARRHGDCVDIEVQDAGIGIAPDFLPYVFDRFRQQDGSITRAHGGLGLGLAIVRQVVELHGGSVRADSAGKDRGARFVVSLPAVEGAPETVAAAQNPAMPRPRLEGVVALVVEDHADMRLVMRTALEEAGARVMEADSAAHATQAAALRRPTVVVSDIGLPDVDGYALLGMLRRALPGAEAVPAVAVSAYVRAEERQRAAAAGYQAYVAKPIDPAALVDTVAGVLARPRQA